MNVGLNITGLEKFYGNDLNGVFDVIGRADRIGVDNVYVSDHLGFTRAAHTKRLETHQFPFPLETPWYEPVTLLSAIAGRTQRIRLSTFILVAPLRPALVLAKQLATLDVISKGRVTIAFGVGWQEDEYRAAGMPFDGRFMALEDIVGAMRALWAPPPATFKGRDFEFTDFYSMPSPMQGADLPILFGLAPMAKNLDRMARLAQGWAVAPSDRPAFAENSRAVKKLCTKYGRDPSKFEFHVGQSAIRKADGSTDLVAVKAAAEAAVADGATTVGFLATEFCRRPAEIDGFLEFIVNLKR